MLTSDVCQFLSPYHLGSFSVKNQEDVCSHCIGTFPKGREGGKFDFHKMHWQLVFHKCHNSSLLGHWRTACLEESRMKTANDHVCRKRLSGLCSKVSDFQMSSGRICDRSME